MIFDHDLMEHLGDIIFAIALVLAAFGFVGTVTAVIYWLGGHDRS